MLEVPLEERAIEWMDGATVAKFADLSEHGRAHDASGLIGMAKSKMSDGSDPVGRNPITCANPMSFY